MSVSKLESLPNEILADLFEKYINGIDILNAFAFQLNHRFDAVLGQCRRFRFDFIRCHKDDFRFCTGLLPAYLERIEELALSEEKTPGQIYAFLSYFPSFIVFKQLRRIYLHINAEAVEPRIVANALRSLSATNLTTLTMKISKPGEIPSLDTTIIHIFRMKTLKKLSLDCYLAEVDWESLTNVASNIEYLTLRGLQFRLDDLKCIFQSLSALKYFNIQVMPGPFFRRYRSKAAPSNAIPRMPTLHTAVFILQEHDEKTPTQLEPYLREMPALRRLEIRCHDEALGIHIWENFFKTSLSKLTYFKLENSVNYLHEDCERALEPIQNPLWIDRPNFHVVLKKLTLLDNDQSDSEGRENFIRSESDSAVDQWWIGPQRKLDDHQSITNTITNLNLSTESISFLQEDHLANVKYLIAHELNEILLEVLTTHVDCSQIKHLDVSFLEAENDKVSILLIHAKNVTSIRINFEQIIHCEQYPKIRFVDFSSARHQLTDGNLESIGLVFPNVEHLIINTRDLRNIPLLPTYLPHLRSLAYRHFESNDRSSNDYRQKMQAELLRRNCQFLFQRGPDLVTVWIDQAALNDPCWRNNVSSSYDSDDEF